MKTLSLGRRSRLPRLLLLYPIILFLSYTLWHKLFGLDAFLTNITKTGMFEGIEVDVVAYSGLALEACSLLLLIVWERVGVYLSLVMMSFFTTYISVLYLLGRYEVCGCGGVLNGLSFPYHLTINIVLLLSLVYFLFYPPHDAS